MKRTYVTMALLAQLFYGCTDQMTDEPAVPATGGIEDLISETGFTFSSESDSYLEASFEGFEAEDRLFMEIYNANPEEGGSKMTSLLINPHQGLNTQLAIPNHVDKLYSKVFYKRQSKLYTLVKSGRISLNISASEFSSKSGATNARSTAFTAVNLIDQGDFEIFSLQGMDQIASEEDITPGVWFTYSDWRREAYTVKIDDDQTLRLKSITHNNQKYDHAAVYAVDVSDWQRGQTFTANFEVKRASGNNVLLFRFEQVDFNGNILSYEESYPAISEAWQSYTDSVIVSEEADQLRLWFYSQTTDGNVYIDNVEGRTSLPDYDGDGIYDDYDVAPMDANITQAVYYPAEGQQATIAFEDMWPYKGDYDFNDLVASYNTTYFMDPAFNVARVTFDIDIKAVGASYNNDFCLNFTDPSHVATVFVTERYGRFKQVNLDGKSEVRFQNIKDLFESSGMINTLESQAKLDPVHLTIQVDLDRTTNINDMITDLYLRVDGEVDREVHLLGAQPTSLADMTMFGIADDNSDIASQFFYNSQFNLPWALNIPDDWQYPQEGVELTRAYPDFATFVQSNPQLDWYSDANNRKVHKKIYKK